MPLATADELGADKDAFLDGGKSYRLRVPANPPVKRFWAVTAYDPATRGLLVSDGQITVGSQTDPVVNEDGSVDLYFGQSAPEGLEANWIKTDPSKGFFTVFRFYGPLEGYIEKTSRPARTKARAAISLFSRRGLTATCQRATSLSNPRPTASGISCAGI